MDRDLDNSHTLSVMKEQRRTGPGEALTTRYRGRCSCGAQTFMHYSTPDAARTAMRRTHKENSHA